MVSKTREKLIEVARQLFLNKGVENTTMNDIAAASDKGRRTIYTYFKNKKEIYNAVVEQQSEILVKELRDIALSSLPPVEKLRKYLTSRFHLLVEVNPRSDRSRYFFNREHKRIERIHRMALAKELEILKALLSEGMASGDYDPHQAASFPAVEVVMTQAVDYINLRDSLAPLGISGSDLRDRIVNFLVTALTANAKTQTTL